MSLYKKFSTDQDKEKKGIWIGIATTDDDKEVGFIVARAGGYNTRFMKVMREVYKPVSAQVQAGTLSPKKDRNLTIQVFVKACLLGWENVTDKEDKPLEFNFANAVQLFEDLPELFNKIFQLAQDAENYKNVALEEDLGN